MEYVIICGKKYPVRFSIRALIEFENKTGMAISSLEKGAKLETLVSLAYFGLKDGARKAKTKLAKNEDLEWLIDCMSEDANLLKLFTDILAKSQTEKEKK